MTWYETIFQQIGNKAFYLLGAKNKVFSETEKYISFRISGSRKVNYIKIELTSLDLYNIEFGKIHGMNYKVVNRIEGIYCDQLHELIEANTGLCTSINFSIKSI